MTILEALIQLRNDLKLWVTNNLRVKLNKNLGTDESGKILTVDDAGDIATTSIDASITELGHMNGVTSNVQEQLDSKADISHTHDEYLTTIPDEYITETELDAKGYLTEHQDLGDYAKTSDVNTALESYYTKTDIEAELDGKSDTGHLHKVAELADLTATATELNYCDGVTSNIQAQLDGKAASSHTHALSDVDGLIDELSGIGNIAQGAANGLAETNELVNDINADIASLYDSKQDTLVSGTNIKTINGESLLGEGDITVATIEDIPDYITTGAKSGTTIGANATAEGNSTEASGNYSHAEGWNTTASNEYSHAEGNGTIASGLCSHAEGGGTIASGDNSHAEGNGTTASGESSHAGGYGTIANDYQYVVGKYNASTTAPTSLTDTTISAGLFIVGIGSSDAARSNGFRVSANGKVYGTGTFGTSGADYAEYFEWFDGNPNNEDRRGHFVTLEGDKIRYATPNDDYILGVVSADPSVAGDIYSEDWHNKYLKDIYGSKIVEVVEVEETTNEKGEIIPAHTERRWVLNPDYNPDVKYVSREERPEWAAIGIVGKLVVVDDGTCQVNGYCYPNADGIATASQEKTNYRVMERLDDAHIKIFIR